MNPVAAVTPDHVTEAGIRFLAARDARSRAERRCERMRDRHPDDPECRRSLRDLMAAGEAFREAYHRLSTALIGPLGFHRVGDSLICLCYRSRGPYIQVLPSPCPLSRPLPQPR